MMKNNVPIFFDQIKSDNSFKNVAFSNKSDTMFINKKVAGFAIPLSTANILKSSSFENVDTIIFDEFLIDKGSYHYLQNEVIQFLDIIETIARLRDIRVLLLANAISITNPYFDFFNIHLPYNSEFSIPKKDSNGQPLILIYYAKNSTYREVKKKTRFGQLIENSQYANYSIDNNFLRDNKSFISKKSKYSKFFFILSVNNKKFGVWIDYKNSCIYISYNYDYNCPIAFSIDPTDHDESTILVKCRTSPFFKSLSQHYQLR